MDYNTFASLVDHNTAMLKQTLAKQDASLLELPPRMYAWNQARGGHFQVLGGKVFDFIPSAFLGLLPSTEKTGTDAYKVLPDGTVVPFELKTTMVAGDMVWQTKSGSLKIGKPVKNGYAELASRLSAAYSVTDPSKIHRKNMQTILLISDVSEGDTYIDAWQMDGNKVVEYINGRTKCDIKLSSFMLHGSRAETVVPLEGYDSWKARLSVLAPVHKVTW